MASEAGKNYFELFGLPVDFDLDAGELARRYREMQRRVHPDKYASGSDAERRISMQLTTLVNEAYQTLRDPVRRARYLLNLGGADTREDTDTAMDPAFLMEQMELRETLAEVRALSEPHKRLAELANDATIRLQQKIGQFRDSYRRDPEQARRSLREMQFLDKLRREIEDLEEELA
jgi:molecular chaperone HscB